MILLTMDKQIIDLLRIGNCGNGDLSAYCESLDYADIDTLFTAEDIAKYRDKGDLTVDITVTDHLLVIEPLLAYIGNHFPNLTHLRIQYHTAPHEANFFSYLPSSVRYLAIYSTNSTSIDFSHLHRTNLEYLYFVTPNPQSIYIPDNTSLKLKYLIVNTPLVSPNLQCNIIIELWSPLARNTQVKLYQDGSVIEGEEYDSLVPSHMFMTGESLYVYGKMGKPR